MKIPWEGIMIVVAITCFMGYVGYHVIYVTTSPENYCQKELSGVVVEDHCIYGEALECRNTCSPKKYFYDSGLGGSTCTCN